MVLGGGGGGKRRFNGHGENTGSNLSIIDIINQSTMNYMSLGS